MTDEMQTVTPVPEPSHIHVPRPSRQHEPIRLDPIFELLEEPEDVDEAAA